MDVLRSRRHGQQHPQAKRRCRINVDPGKSISREDLQEAAGSASIPSTSRKQAESFDPETSDDELDLEGVDASSSSSGPEAASQTSDDDLEEVDAPSNNSSRPEAACQLPQSPDGPSSAVAGSFYLVRFTTRAKHGCKMYVAMCEGAETHDCVQMNFMRKASGDNFIWPEKRDIAEIHADQLVCKLSQPDIDRRGSLHFKKEELSAYRLMLA